MTAPRHFHQAVAAAKASIGKGDTVTRPTAEIEADLRLTSIASILDQAGSVALKQYVKDAADRLAELESELTSYENWRRRVPHLIATLPDCPTCGGTLTVRATTPSPETAGAARCPDCVDGKVSVAQLAATWRAVWGGINIDPSLVETDHEAGYVDAFRDLRAVKP